MFPLPNISKYLEWRPDLFVSDSESLNQRDGHRNSLLHYAARDGHLEAVQHLLKLKADPNDRNLFGETPLIFASVKSDSKVVSSLLNADCDVNIRDNRGNSALSYAAFCRQLETVKLLVGSGADVSVTDKRGNSCLHAALLKRTEESVVSIVKVLLATDGAANINSMTFEGNTPLHLLATGCSADCYSERLEIKKINGCWRYVGLDYQSSNEDSFYYQGAVLPRITVLNLLLDNKADVLRRNARGETPLIRAAAAGCSHVVDVLLGRMTPEHVDLTNNYGQTALIRAAQNHHPYVVQQLLSAGASVNCRDYRGCTALHAVICGPVECLSTPLWNVHCLSLSNEELGWRDRAEIVVKVLLDIGHAQVDITDWKNETAFDLLCKAPELYSNALQQMLAVKCEMRDALNEKRDLVHRKQPSVRTDKRGRTPLHCLTTEWKIIWIVIHVIFDEFENGRAVIEQAIEKGSTFHLEWVPAARAVDMIIINSTVRDDKGRIPLHYLAMSSGINPSEMKSKKNKVTCYEQMVKTMLVDGNSCANVTDVFGRTPLHYADSKALQKILISYGARTDVRDIDGFTPEEFQKLKATGRRLNISDIKVIQSIYHTEIALYAAEVLQNAKLFPKRCNLLKTLRPNFDTTTTAWRIWTELDYAYRKKDCQSYEEVDAFMTRLLTAIQTLYPLFKSRHILVGSTREGTAISLQNEFDIDVILTEIDELCEVVESPVSPKGYVLLRKRERKTPVCSRKDTEFLFNEDGYLVTDQLNLRFQHALVEVLKDGEFWKNEPVFELELIEEVKLIAFRFSSPLCKTLKLSRIRPTASKITSLEISIDIVPCIYIDGWWPERALTDVSDDLKADGCNLVLDLPQRKFPWVPYSEPYARISFAPAESGSIANSSAAAKAAFMVCKHMLYGQNGSTYLLKMSLLYCIEALREKFTHRRNFEEVTSKELTLWVRKLLQCYLYFCLQDFVPCYFMPTFLQPFEGYFRSEHMERYMTHKLRERRYIVDEVENEDSLMRAFRLYWSVCDTETEVDFQIPSPQPLFEKFNRKELIESLSKLTND